MQFGFGMGPDTSWMREELTQLGVEELIQGRCRPSDERI